MKKIEIKEAMNGWKLEVAGFNKVNGPYVFKSTDILLMLEFVGENINGRKVDVIEK